MPPPIAPAFARTVPVSEPVGWKNQPSSPQCVVIRGGRMPPPIAPAFARTVPVSEPVGWKISRSCVKVARVESSSPAACQPLASCHPPPSLSFWAQFGHVGCEHVRSFSLRCECRMANGGLGGCFAACCRSPAAVCSPAARQPLASRSPAARQPLASCLPAARP